MGTGRRETAAAPESAALRSPRLQPNVREACRLLRVRAVDMSRHGSGVAVLRRQWQRRKDDNHHAEQGSAALSRRLAPMAAHCVAYLCVFDPAKEVRLTCEPLRVAR